MQISNEKKSNFELQWVHGVIGDLCEIITGNTPSKKELENYGKHIPFVKPPELKNSLINCSDDNLSKRGSKKSRILPKDSILISCIGNLGKVGMNSVPVAFNQQINAIIPSSIFCPKFLFYQAQSYEFKLQLASLASATTLPIVNKGKFATIDVKIPGLPEQQQIVVKIEELFSELDNGIESLKKAREQLKTYRQAVLKYAFEGKLTKEWRTQQMRSGNPPEPAEKLLEQIKTERGRHYQKQLEDWERACEEAKADGKKKPAKPKKPKELPPLKEKELAELPKLPEGWGWMKSGSLFSFVTSGSRGWAKYYSSTGSIFIRIANLDFDSLKIDLNRNNIQFVKPPIGSEGTRTRIEKGDFLFSITGYLGMFAIVPDLRDAYINQHIALARPFNGFNKEYVGYYCIAKTGGYFHLNKNQKGATKAGLTLEDIRTFPVPLCPVSEQNQIVSEIESRLSVCDKIEQTIEDSLKKAEAMRQSILKKAFSGELTKDWREKHPELITGENSAETLLEKIKAEKALSVSLKKPRSNKTKKK